MNEFVQNDPLLALVEDRELSQDDFIESFNRQLISELPLTQRLSQLKILGDEFLVWFEQQGDVEDLEMSIDFRSQLLALIPNDHPDRPMELYNMGRLLRVRYERLVNLEDLDKALEYQELAVSLVSDIHNDKPVLLSGLGTSLWRRFEDLGDFADLEKAIECHNQAISLASDDFAEKPRFLNGLGVALLSQFEHVGDLPDIDRAIVSQRQAVSLASDDNVGRPGFLSNLGISLGSRFERLGSLDDLDESIRCQQQAVEIRSDSNEGKPRVLVNLGNSYQRRFERLGNPNDINRAIGFQKQAVSLSPDEHIEKPGLLGSLGTAYLIRGQRLGNLDDINRAIEHQQKALQIVPEGHPSKSGLFGNLGSSYQSRSWRSGKLADVNDAIEYHSMAVSLRPDGHPGIPHMLTNLGYSYQSRFRHLGDIVDIDKAIECQQRAVSLTPDGHAEKPRFLHNLGMAYRNRAQGMGELLDIDDAIRYQEQAVSLTLDGHAEKPKFLCGLGDSYQLRFAQSESLTDIEKAIQYQQQAALNVPDNFVEKPGFLVNLGNSYLRRAGLSNSLEDIDKGIEYYHQANMLIADDSIEKHDVLQNIGVSLHHRFDQSDDLADVDKGIEYQQRSLSLLPDDHAQRAILFKYLGESYQIRHRRSGVLADAERAIDYFRQSATSATGPALTMFESTRMWINMSAQHDGCSSLDAYRAAIALIPRLVRLGTTVQRRYVDTVYLGDLVTEAAAAAVALGQHACAVEWLEEGRSIVWGQRLQLRTTLDELRVADAKLASQLELVGRSLEMVGAVKVDHDWALDHPIMPEEAAQRQRWLAAEWSKLVDEARQLPGFENFLRPKSLAQLLPAAERGPVIVVNVHTTRCDALVLLPNTQTVTHIPLPSLSYKTASQAQVNWARSLQQRGVRDRGFIRPGTAQPGRGMFEHVLSLLWTSVVEPIFTHLGFLCIQPDQQLPHITWCATGPLAFLPIHAAGCYNKSKAEFKVYDYAITSYTPTLSGLLVSAKRPKDFSGILAVAQEATLGLSSLPCAIEELERIERIADGLHLELLKGTGATVEAVSKAMEECAWVHLACHAIQDLRDPTDSALFLSDGKLSLAAIAQKSLKHGEFAFLSACQTAVGHQELPEEAIHLAAGMIMAGYATVIGTMWSIKDKHAPLIAGRVYASLLEGKIPDSRRAAKALHDAVAALRKEVGEDKYEEWAPFVHIGL